MEPDWLFLQIKIQLQKFLYILKWTLLTLTFWLVFIVLFAYIYPNTPIWYFGLLLIGAAWAWVLFFREKKPRIWFFISMLALLLFTWGLLNMTPVQNWLVGRVTKTLSKNLQTKVSIGHINLSFFNKMSLKRLMIEDRGKDTLLYAGTASVNITDWFFLKDHISINNLALDNAVVNMHRRDSVWNYQFLLDYFSPPKSKKTQKEPIQLNVKELHFTDITFNKTDEWVGQNMAVSLSKMNIIVDKLDVPGKQLIIKDIYLEKPLFWQSDYEGRKPKVTDLTSLTAKIPVISAFKWNKSGWMVKAGKLQIFDGSFRNEKYTTRDVYANMFDSRHILFSSINGNLSDLVFLNDTLRAGISLNAKERSGLVIKKLESNLRFTPDLMEFNNLELQTNKSRLSNYFSMSYKSFNKDMSSFIHNVILDANFKESVLSTDDLAIFAPQLSSMKRVFALEGHIKGTIDNFSARRIKIRTGASFIDGNIAIRGLPDINSTFIDVKSNLLQTNYTELVSIIPALRKVTTPALPKLGNIKYTGNFTGFVNDFVAYGIISTNLGNITADLNMKLPKGGTPSYSGKLNTAGFQLGEFLNDRKLGNIALNGTIKGSGFSLSKLNADFKGDINRLYYAGYTYQNAHIDGNFKNKIFKGTLSVNDPNLQVKNLEGEVNLSGKEMGFRANANLDFIDFRSLGFSKDRLTLSGVFNLNFSGNNIDNFLGSARIYDARLQVDSTRLSFDSLSLKSFVLNNRKTLEVESNELYVKLEGLFKIMELPAAFSTFLNRYYPTYIPLPKKKVSEQDFDFDIRTRQVDEYIRLVDKRLEGFNESRVQGHMSLGSHQLTLNAFVPEFSYDGKEFNNTTLVGTGTRDTLFADITAEDIKVSDSLHFPDTRINVAAHNDISVIKLTTSAGTTLNDAELNASIQNLKDGVRIHFFPSSFVLNGKKWLLEKDGELTLRKNFIDASEVKFVHERQQIVLSTELDELTDGIHLRADLQNVVMEDFLPFWVTTPSLKGRLTGTARVRDPQGKPKIEFEGTADSFSVDDKYIGKINLVGNANLQTGLITYKASTNETDYVFDVEGFYKLKKDSTAARMSNTLRSQRINLNILEPYLKSIFTQVNGIGKGDLVLTGNTMKDMTITGDVTVDTASVKVAFTQCRYNFSNEVISFGKNMIDLGTIRLKDTLNNTGTASGKMYHNFFRNFSFENMRVESGKMLVLNTTKKDNSKFYGTVIGSALMTMNGPTTNLRMNIDGQPSVFDTSHIYLLTSETSRENTKIDYLDFIQFGTEMDKPLKNNQATNIVVNMNITANPSCKVDVILDEETGDIIKGQGNGQLNIRVGNVEPLSIRGRYDLTRGEYTFNFQTFLERPFTLNRGSITWNGDPYLAIIDIDAEYLAKNVDISNLSSSSGFKKSDIIILSHLSGNLGKPEIKFQFQLPQQSELRNDYFIVKKLEDFRNDENEMFKEVASLLLLNRFTSGENFISGGSTVAIATSTIGGVVSSWLTNIFNKELDRATKGVISTYIDINPTVDLRSQANQLQANVRAGLKILFSSRINLLVVGNYDYNNPYLQASGRGLITPDITLEWLLNKDGSLRVVGFNRTSVDFTSSQRVRSGVQLSYRKNFNKLSDIFKSRKKLMATDTIPAPVTTILN
jgi:hypothetical protein